MRRTRAVHITAHPEFYDKLNELRKQYQKINGRSISLTEASRIIAKNIKTLTIPTLNLKTKKNVKAKKR